MNTSGAVDVIRQMAAKFQGITDLADVLERIGSLENAETEARARLGAIRVEVAAAEAGAVEAQHRLASIEANAKDSLEAATNRARAVKDEAEGVNMARSAQITADATKTKTDAQTAASVIAEVANRVKAAILIEVQAAKDELADMRAELSTKAKQLDELNTKIAKAKASIKGLLSD